MNDKLLLVQSGNKFCSLFRFFVITCQGQFLQKIILRVIVLKFYFGRKIAQHFLRSNASFTRYKKALDEKPRRCGAAYKKTQSWVIHIILLSRVYTSWLIQMVRELSPCQVTVSNVDKNANETFQFQKRIIRRTFRTAKKSTWVTLQSLKLISFQCSTVFSLKKQVLLVLSVLL